MTNRAERRRAQKRQHTDRNKTVGHCASIFKVMARTQPYTVSEQAQLQIPVYAALGAMKSGAATSDDMGTLCIVCNACMILGEKISEECVALAKTAMHALARSEQRLLDTGHYGLDGEGLRAITDCIDLHDQLLSLVTPQQMTKAYDEMRRRIAAGETLDVRTMQ